MEETKESLNKMMKMSKTLKFKDMIDRKTGVISNATNSTVSIPASGFPYALWVEWNEDCIKHYNDIRWLKMWTDHQKSLKLDELMVLQKIEPQEQKKGPNDITLIGDGYIEQDGERNE